jgi:hypothetical protein
MLGALLVPLFGQFHTEVQLRRIPLPRAPVNRRAQRLGGLATLRLYGTSWYVLLALRR